jgi:hypothetical protein
MSVLQESRTSGLICPFLSRCHRAAVREQQVKDRPHCCAKRLQKEDKTTRVNLNVGELQPGNASGDGIYNGFKREKHTNFTFKVPFRCLKIKTRQDKKAYFLDKLKGEALVWWWWWW